MRISFIYACEGGGVSPNVFSEMGQISRIVLHWKPPGSEPCYDSHSKY